MNSDSLYTLKKWTQNLSGSLFRKVLFSLLDQASFSGSNFLVSLLLARWLSSDEYGAYSVTFSLFLLLAGLQIALIFEPMAVFGAKSHYQSLPEYFGFLFVSESLISLIIALSITGIAFFVSQPIQTALWGLSVGILPIYSFWLFRQACYVESRSNLAMIGSVIYAFVLLCGTFILFQIGSFSPLTTYLLMGLSGLVASIFLWFALPVKFGKIDVRKILSENWVYGKWIIVASIASWLSINIYPSLINVFWGLSGAGAFRAMQNLILPLQQGLSAIYLLLLPWLARWQRNRGLSWIKETNKKIVFALLLLTIVYSGILVIFGPLFVRFIYRRPFFEDFLWLLPYLGLSMVLVVPGQILGLSLRIYEQSSNILWIKLATAIAILICVPISIHLLNIQGIGVCLLLSSLVETITCIVFYIKVTEKHKAYANN
jgi:O-antigen/teichoic acid export membrane protein